MCYNGKNREYKLLAAICSDKDELKSLCEGDKTMEKYENEINKLNDDEKFCNFMSQEKEAEMLQNTLIHYAENDGLQKGLTKKAKEIALKMLSKGKDIKEISELTGLPIETIEKLK